MPAALSYSHGNKGALMQSDDYEDLRAQEHRAIKWAATDLEALLLVIGNEDLAKLVRYHLEDLVTDPDFSRGSMDPRNRPQLDLEERVNYYKDLQRNGVIQYEKRFNWT